MLRSLKDLMGYKINTKDDEIGSVISFLFDDMNWVIRYMVVSPGIWFSDRKVLISPIVIEEYDWNERVLQVGLFLEEIQNSPSIETNMPVSLQREIEKNKQSSWPILFQLLGNGPYIFTSEPPEDDEDLVDYARREPRKDRHLRSTQEVIDYYIEAKDGDIGHVEDFIVDDKITWTIRYVVVDTHNWLPGRKVLISPSWVEGVSWEKRKVYLDHTKDEIENSPEYDPSDYINREYEDRLYDYYGRPKYWD